ncbi:MAG: hypothetical protein JW861_07275 [Bacteroidales bacterium]|nr:hypothetical protein [Bacteroidales bacterium]
MTEQPHPYICPLCGKEYPIPPKWCPCRPYPWEPPRISYFLVRSEGMSVPEVLEDDMYPLQYHPWKEILLLSEEAYQVILSNQKKRGGAPHDTMKQEDGELFLLIRQEHTSFIETTDTYHKTVTRLGRRDFNDAV